MSCGRRGRHQSNQVCTQFWSCKLNLNRNRCVDHRLSNENHCILLQHAALIRLRNGKPKEAESSARRAMRLVYSSFDPDVSSDAEASIHLPPIHSLGLVGSLLNFCFILYKTAQSSKAITSLNVSIHLLQEMMPFQVINDVQMNTNIAFWILTVCGSLQKQCSWCLLHLAWDRLCNSLKWPRTSS